MTRYKVSYIVNNQEKIQRAIDAESHEEAYERFLEIDGAKNYTIKTFSFENRTEKLWEDHYGLIKEQRKIIIQELITNSDKGVDYIQLNQSTRDFCEKEFNNLLKKQLNDWTTEEKDFYLLYKDYRGRSAYLELKQKPDDTSDNISRKLDAITKLLMTIAELQASSSKAQSQILETSKTSGLLSALSLVHEMNDD